jgi:hypothetical protein
MKNPNKVPAIFLFVFGSIFLVSGVIQFILNSNLENNGVLTNGIVTKMQYRNSRKGKATYVPIILYKAKDGKEYELRSNIYYDDSTKYKKGDTIEIYYNPNDADEATLANENEATIPLVMGGGFGLLMCIGGIMVYKKGKKKLRANTEIK